MTSQGGQEIITIQKLSNISRSKGNQTKKLYQLIEYNINNSFLEKPCINLIEKLVPDHFIKN